MLKTLQSYALSIHSIRSLLLALTLSLIGCGGGSSSSSSDGNNPLNTSPTTWALNNYSGTSITSASVMTSLIRSGEDIYVVEGGISNTNLLKTTDGNQWTEFTTHKLMPVLIAIDELGRVYFDDASSDDLVNYTLQTDEAPFNTFISGSSTVLIGVDSIFNRVERSTDGGDTWSTLDLDGDTNTDESVLAFRPAYDGASSFLVIDETSGLWRTVDSGNNWTQILTSEGRFDAVTANPNMASTFFAAKNGAILISTDGGFNWSNVSVPMSNGQPITEYLDIELLDDGTILAWGLSDNDGETLGQVYVSSDNGQSWSSMGDRIGESRSSITSLGTSEITANSSHYFLTTNLELFSLPR